MTAEDLKFLVHQRVALRFQHAEYNEHLHKNGSINGDAYSIAYPREWFPATAENAARFENALKEKVGSVMGFAGFSSGDTNGSFLLLRNIDKARRPVVDREIYPGPLYSIGAGTEFKAHQQIGIVHVTQARELRGWTQETLNEKGIEKLTAHLTQKIVGQIKQARRQLLTHAHDSEVAVAEQKKDIEGIFIMRENLVLAAERRAKIGIILPPIFY